MYRYLTQQQLIQLRALASVRDRLLLDVLLETGCTAAELVALKSEHLSTNSILVAGRTVTIPRALAKALRTENEYLFSTRQSPQLTVRRVQQLVTTYLTRLGLPDQTPQLFRYTHIHRSVARGENLEEIAKRIDLSLSRLQQIIGFQENLPAPELIEHIEEKTKEALIVRTLLATGATAEALTSLKKEDVKDTELVLEGKRVPVPRSLTRELKRVDSASLYVFSTRQSPQISARRIQQIVKEELQRHGANDKTPQLLRYAHVTKAAQNGEAPKEIAIRLGITEERVASILGAARGGLL